MNHYISILHAAKITMTKPRVVNAAGMKPSWVKTLYIYDTQGQVTTVEVHAHEEADLTIEEDTR